MAYEDKTDENVPRGGGSISGRSAVELPKGGGSISGKSASENSSETNPTNATPAEPEPQPRTISDKS
jgi:hypothetical protein